MTTVADCIARALSGFDALAITAEPIDDEWQYVTDLGTVWRARLTAVATARSDEPAPVGALTAIDMLVAEAALVSDPHRAIDWLSTLPQVALAALGEAAWCGSRTRRRTRARSCTRGSRRTRSWRAPRTSSPTRPRPSGSSPGRA